MSLINDALKRAKQAPPRNTPNAVLPMQPATAEASSLPSWLLLAVIVILIFAAIFFIGWSVSHHAVRTIAATPDPETTQDVVVVQVPVVEPKPAPPEPVEPPDLPRLQGIFYSATSPSAIVDGKTVRPGDKFRQYQVKEITKYTVTLLAPDGKAIKLGMSN